MTPSGNLFSNTAGSTGAALFSSGPLFGGQAARAPASSGQSTEIPSSGGLFGSSTQRPAQANPAPAPAQGLFGSSSGGLFSTAPVSGSGAQGAGAGALFGSMLGSSSTQQPTAAGTVGGSSGLFGMSGTSATAGSNPATSDSVKGPQSGIGSVANNYPFKSLGVSSTLGTASGTATGSATELVDNSLSGPAASSGSTDQPSALSSMGTLGLAATSAAPGSSLFGSATSKATKPQTSTSGNLLQVPQPSKTTTAVSKESSTTVKETSSPGSSTSILDASQYERLDQLLRKWDIRVQRQIADFASIAETVMNLDLDLCASSSRLASMQLDQQQIAKKQQEIDEAIGHTEMQQQRLAEMLQQMEAALSAKKLPPAGVNRTGGTNSTIDDGDVQQQQLYLPSPAASSPSQLLQARLHGFSAVLDDTGSFIQELTNEVNAIQAKLYPGAIGEILDLLNIQQLAISRIEDDAQLIRERLKQVHYHLQ